MKTKIFIIAIIGLLAVFTLIFYACEKEEKNQIPTCNINTPTEGDEFKQGEIITISANASDYDGSIAEVLFFVGGVQKSSVNSSPYTYEWDTDNEDIGNHILKTTANDNEGASASDEVSIVIVDGKIPPESAFKAFPSCGVPPLTIDFTDQSINDPTDWQWDFGDGNIAEVLFFVGGVQKSSVNSSPYTYEWDTDNEDIGNHILKTTANDNEGASASDEVSIVIVDGKIPPESAFKAFPSCGVPPLTIDFTDQSINDPTDWQWDFGDGNMSTETNPSHTYNSEGSFTVILTVTNSYGSDTETIANCINVSENGCSGIFTDPRDNKNYDVITIGTQTWFAENLNFETENSWCFDDNIDYCITYGRLYTWEAALNACPDGWHLPSDDEWKILEMYIGMSQSEADKISNRGTDEGLKLKSTSGWKEPGNGTDVYGFAALPGGYRYPSGGVYGRVISSWWWASTEKMSDRAYGRGIEYLYDQIARSGFNKNDAISVRCLKDL